MKKRSMIMAGTVAALVGCGSVVQAVPITGSIGFTGTYTQNGGTRGNLSTATSMTVNTIGVGTTSGSFIGAIDPTFAASISVNPAVGVGRLWTVKVGSITYTFDSTSESENLDTPTGLHLIGTGSMADGTPADTDTGTWQLGFGVSGDSFEWQSTASPDAPTGVPDGGSTAMLLGAGCFGIGLLKRKVKA